VHGLIHSPTATSIQHKVYSTLVPVKSRKPSAEVSGTTNVRLPSKRSGGKLSRAAFRVTKSENVENDNKWICGNCHFAYGDPADPLLLIMIGAPVLLQNCTELYN